MHHHWPNEEGKVVKEFVKGDEEVNAAGQHEHTVMLISRFPLMVIKLL